MAASGRFDPRCESNARSSSIPTGKRRAYFRADYPGTGYLKDRLSARTVDRVVSLCNNVYILKRVLAGSSFRSPRLVRQVGRLDELFSLSFQTSDLLL